MKKSIVVFCLCGLFLLSCKDKYEVKSYYTQAEQDTLLTNIITYVYSRPTYADWQSRFELKYRKYYVSHIKDFQFQHYFIDEDSTHYFYLIRPARGPEGNIRGVGGSFKMDRDGKITSFKEVFNTPIATQEQLNTRGVELFKWMVLHGNIDDYLKNPDYIEWPNQMTYYDTIQHEWLIKPGL
ncbi:MAG TPA: hypothetical protein VFU05_00345 [Cyclobacteriaceae bacterium]|nr:hypothetical protein [Cyclobacteriaceae bacterium]